MILKTKQNRATLGLSHTHSYQGYKIESYTYTLENHNSKFMVNTNIFIKDEKNDFLKTLAINESFKDENKALEHGLKLGENFIDKFQADKSVSFTLPKKDKKTKAKKTAHSANKNQAQD